MNKGVFQRFNVYYNYSHLFEDEEAFPDSQLHNPGGVLEFGPFWVWIDFLWGKKAWYLNGPEQRYGCRGYRPMGVPVQPELCVVPLIHPDLHFAHPSAASHLEGRSTKARLAPAEQFFVLWHTT